MNVWLSKETTVTELQNRKVKTWGSTRLRVRGLSLMAQYAHLSQPDHEWLKVASVLPASPIPTDIVRFRKDGILARKIFTAKLGPPITAGLTVAEKPFAVAGDMIPMRTYVPHQDQNLGEDKTRCYPVLFWIFGGAFCLGSLDDDDTLLRSLTVELRISCVSIDYRKTPEHAFSVGLNDCYAALRWVGNNVKEIRGDVGKGFIVGGISFGSNFTATMVQRALVDPGFKGRLTGQIHVMPSVLHPRAHFGRYTTELRSAEQNKDSAFLNVEWLNYIYDMCNAPNPSDPEISPILAPKFAGLPPAYLQICGLDPLRDEGFLYARLLREADVPTKVDAYPGFPHGFHVFYPELEASCKQSKDFKEGLKWLLQSK